MPWKQLHFTIRDCEIKHTRHWYILGWHVKKWNEINHHMCMCVVADLIVSCLAQCQPYQVVLAIIIILSQWSSGFCVIYIPLLWCMFPTDIFWCNLLVWPINILLGHSDAAINIFSCQWSVWRLVHHCVLSHFSVQVSRSPQRAYE